LAANGLRFSAGPTEKIWKNPREKSIFLVNLAADTPSLEESELFSWRPGTQARQKPILPNLTLHDPHAKVEWWCWVSGVW
jgi:hypothetical protein